VPRYQSPGLPKSIMSDESFLIKIVTKINTFAKICDLVGLLS
jgi:hypothetical protein